MDARIDQAGEQTGPLIDSYGRTHTYLRISVTDRCNLRCTYCMPPEGIEHTSRERILRFDEIVRLARILAQIGVTKVRLTGGEPLVRRDIGRLIGDLSGIERIHTIGLTTNGVLLAKCAKELRAVGLSRLNVSLDTLRPERFARITLRDNYHLVRAGIDTALAVGFVPLKLNVVVIGGVNDDEITDFVEIAHRRPINVRFIEYMPFAVDSHHHDRFVSSTAIRRAIEKQYTLTPVLAGENGDAVAREFSIPGFAGTIGFISPMTNHFCNGCNRLRLTAEGSIKSCLFYPAETNLRDAMRAGATDTELAGLIRRVVNKKSAGHPPVEMLPHLDQQTMIRIGG